MKILIKMIVLLIPFYLFGQTNVIEPELVSNQELTNILPYDFSKHNGKVYVNAKDVEHGLELWVFDEKINSLRMVKDINPNGDSDPIVVNTELEDVLLFVAKDENGTGLWATDGTEEGTIKLKELDFFLDNSGGINAHEATKFRMFKNKIYFSASVTTSFEHELWCTDGTIEGTKLFKDMDPNGTTSPYYMRVIAEKLIFKVYKTSNKSREVWSTDGTTENTIKLSNCYSEGESSLENLNSGASTYFFLDSLDNQGVLWVTDGTMNGTIPLTNKFDFLNLNTNSFALLGDKLYFSGRLSGGELVLFVSDGSQDGTRQVKTISLDPNSELSLMSYKGTEEQNLYFSLVEEGNYSLWISDGTSENTKKIAESLKNLNGRMSPQSSSKTFFIATDDEHGDELWVSEGTVESTHIVKDLIEGPVGSDLWFASIIVDGKVLFFFEDENGETATWITDGTESGTFILNPDLMDITHMSFYDNLYGNMLLFVEESKADTVRMWQTDMTKEGTSIIMPNDPNYSYYIYSYPFFQVELKNHVYFFAYHENKPQLYRIPNTISSVEESKLPELMTVYPNPAKDYIQLELTKPMQLSIINSTGAKVKDYGIVDNGKLNVAELRSGVYFVVDEQGNNIAKFVKE